ncbi:MAG: hypothetical protein N2112_02415 [Gemmataceae bacterium]|jgi:(2Fe-2S) ferredoxin|nr:hypothetical protein [Gemmataceae bacterium]
MDRSGELNEVAEKLGIGHYQRHVLLCVGDQCCSPAEGQAAWEALKSELKNKGLSLSQAPNACYRTKAGCLRVCKSGPIAVVYPEGVWYHSMTADRIPQLVQQHLIEGQPLADLVFAENPLSLSNHDEERKDQE